MEISSAAHNNIQFFFYCQSQHRKAPHQRHLGEARATPLAHIYTAPPDLPFIFILATLLLLLLFVSFPTIQLENRVTTILIHTWIEKERRVYLQHHQQQQLKQSVGSGWRWRPAPCELLPNQVTGGLSGWVRLGDT